MAFVFATSPMRGFLDLKRFAGGPSKYPCLDSSSGQLVFLSGWRLPVVVLIWIRERTILVPEFSYHSTQPISIQF